MKYLILCFFIITGCGSNPEKFDSFFQGTWSNENYILTIDGSELNFLNSTYYAGDFVKCKENDQQYYNIFLKSSCIKNINKPFILQIENGNMDMAFYASGVIRFTKNP